jgi:hypothetical protein
MWKPLYRLLREERYKNLEDAIYSVGNEILPDIEDHSEWILDLEHRSGAGWYESIPGYSALVDFDFAPTDGFIADHIVFNFFGLDDGGDEVFVFFFGADYWYQLPFVGSFRKSESDGLIRLLLDGPIEGGPVFGADLAKLPASIRNHREDLITRDQLLALSIAQLPALGDWLGADMRERGIEDWSDSDLERRLIELFGDVYS